VIKRPGREADYSLPPKAEVTNERSDTSTRTYYAFTDCTWPILHLLYLYISLLGFQFPCTNVTAHSHNSYPLNLPNNKLAGRQAGKIFNTIHFPTRPRKYSRLSTETGWKFVGVGCTIHGRLKYTQHSSKIPDSRTNFLIHVVIWYLNNSEPCLPQTLISMVEALSYTVIRLILPVTSTALIYFTSNRGICCSVQNISSSWLLPANITINIHSTITLLVVCAVKFGLLCEGEEKVLWVFENWVLR
jgi:hypothetical protein